ncbi:hypothetical protein FACS1894109_07800 [Spirochaetia bacterium]|nr:hypothetical protein FACS1894109_07800 [Spirochaetia bacterium]
MGTLIFLAILFPAGVFSQVESPHVSDLRAEVRGNLIRLTWKDSPEAAGSVFIYRSNSPFDTVDLTPEQMRTEEVPYGAESYIDETESSGWIYYFAAASRPGGSAGANGAFTAIMPLNNTIAVNVRFEEMEFPAPAAVSFSRHPLGISGLNTVINGEGVTISYDLNDSTRDTILYRSVQPIGGPEDLLRAVIVQSGLFPPFVDYPVPGIPYYYAVIFEDDLSRGAVEIIPGINATTEAITVNTRSGRIGLPGTNTDLRSMPLPLMSLNYAVPGIDSFSELSAPIPLGRDAARAVSNTPRMEPKIIAPKKPRAFGEDLREDDEDRWEEYGLKAIVRDSFLAQDWKTVIADMRRYLSLPRSELTEARARFYLGQSLYFSASYEEALVEFLMMKNQFPGEASEWIDASLAQLINR